MSGWNGPQNTDVVGFEIEAEQVHGAPGFLQVKRLRLRNRRADGSVSDAYACDFVVRPRGPDAVVVALYHLRDARPQVLIREGLRPALTLGRPTATLPIPDPRVYLRFAELVAGIIEPEDLGELGVRRRASIEVEEEAGYDVVPEAVVFLGAGTFPTPGSMPEKYWLVAAEITDPRAHAPPQTDGSPLEASARLQWMDLDEAIAACVAGTIEDAKTELALRRLRDRLRGPSPS
jgi:ADP-ribose pyrophosphatase